MEPLVFDGVGTVFAINPDGTLKYVDLKVNKVTAQLQFDWQKVMGGDSGYAFHFTAQDLQDKVSIEVPRFSPALAELSQGAETTSGNVIFDENEEGVLVTTDGYTIKKGTTLVTLSDSVYLKDVNGVLTPLTRVATVPTATEYAITAAGKITSAVANDGKVIIVVYKWTKTNGTTTGFSGLRKPKPFRFAHRFTLRNDRDGSDVDCQLLIYKALGGGTLDVSQERKKPSVMAINLEIMEPDISAENPNRNALELKFGI
jgi:hypothetical protein